jgi:hypothetical protein
MQFKSQISARVILVIAIAFHLTAIAQDQTPSPQNDPRQAEINVLTKSLLQTIDQQRIDTAFDGLDDIGRKRIAIDAAVAAFQQQIVNGVVDQKQYDALYQDYVTYRNACSPRLTGRIVRIGADQPFKDIASAAMKIKAGDLVLLGEGEYELPDGRSLPARIWSDVAIVGRSPKLTTLKVTSIEATFRFANRFLLEGLRIDCHNDGIFDLRTASTFHLRGCELFNYNSGAGGSNSLFANDSIALMEGCLFEGRSGRQAASTSGGNAFDFRGHCNLFVRQSQFIDNREILRATFPCVFDGCTALSVFSGPGQVSLYSEGKIWQRDSLDLIDNQPQAVAFTLATDDLNFVKRAAGQEIQIDQQSQSLIDSLALSRRLPYWIGLVRHENSEIRAIAGGHLSKLIGMEVSASPPGDPPQKPDQSNRLDEGTPALAAEVEFARLMKWFEDNRAALQWDDATNRYIAQGR